MADIRSISLVPGWQGSNSRIVMELEATEPNMTIGNQYELVALLVDSQPVPPKPFALMLDDTGHFRLVDLGKVRRPTT
jgi:hypothetical protein